MEAVLEALEVEVSLVEELQDNQTIQGGQLYEYQDRNYNKSNIILHADISFDFGSILYIKLQFNGRNAEQYEKG